MPKYHVLQRGVCLALFTLSGLWSCLNPHAIPVAAISLIGVIAYDVVCYLKERSKPKDFGPEIEEMKAKHEATYQIIKEMKDDVSVAKLANSFRSR